jgi:probable H4MPT-linked C1 transfer pathway protein
VNWIGLDIGGANLKASNGENWTREIPFPLWKHPESLADALRSLTEGFVSDETIIAVTMTGELADCFATKSEGVDRILSSVDQAFPAQQIQVWQTGGEFVSPADAREFPVLVAAANWHAQATWVGRACSAGVGLLIDIGSTTTDIIPLSQGMPVAEGGTDPLRLLSGELVYTGVRRTPLMALGAQLEFRGQSIGVAAELFATTRDLYLWSGDLPESPADCDTANGRPATREHAGDRLTRMLCGDRDDITLDEVDHVVGQWIEMQQARIRQSIERVIARQAAPVSMVLLSGEGEFLATRVVDSIPSLAGLETLSLARLLGPLHSVGACAFAVARLAAERPFLADA